MDELLDQIDCMANDIYNQADTGIEAREVFSAMDNIECWANQITSMVDDAHTELRKLEAKIEELEESGVTKTKEGACGECGRR